MTFVASVVQEKGGAGKTTLLASLASLLSERGHRVAVIDTDPQRHLESWAAKDKLAIDYLYEENDEKLIPTVRFLKKSEPAFDIIFIDTAGFKSAMAMHAIAAADLVLIPSKANEADAKGAVRTHSHVTSVADTMGRSIASTVIMMDIDPHTNITQSVVDAIDNQGLPRLQAMCGHRTGFKEMTSTGTAPTGRAKAAAEAILDELLTSGLIKLKEHAHGKA